MTEALFNQDAYLQHCTAQVTAVDENGIVLDRTVFYAMGGGQPGDTGKLRRQDGAEIVITDTRKGNAGAILHIPAADSPSLQAGDQVEASIDWERRYRHMKMHTCMHLLCSIVDAGVTGGSISADKARLDFDLPEQTLDKQQLTQELNSLIQKKPSGK